MPWISWNPWTLPAYGVHCGLSNERNFHGACLSATAIPTNGIAYRQPGDALEQFKVRAQFQELDGLLISESMAVVKLLRSAGHPALRGGRINCPATENNMKKMMKTKLKQHTALFAAGSLLFGAPALLADDPATAPDDSWVSVSGKVTEVNPQTFVLDYDSGKITVEFDDWDADADAYKLVKGDKVTVTGKIDDDLFEKRTIEGSSVYVDSIKTYYYASAADEEDYFVTIVTPLDGAETSLQGTVTSITGDEFVIDTGTLKTTVETEELGYNPLDDKGYQKIEVGDRVSVTGEFDDDFFEGYELVADSVITLSSNG